MVKRLKDFKTENRKPRPPSMSQVMPMQSGDDEASMRVMMHAANRVISRHLVELKKLAYQ